MRARRIFLIYGRCETLHPPRKAKRRGGVLIPLLVLEHRGAVHFFGERGDGGAGGAEAPFALGLGRPGGIAEWVVKMPGAVVDDAVDPDVARHVGQAGDDDGRNALPLQGSRQRSPAARAGASRGGEDDALDSGLFKFRGPGAADAVHLGECAAVPAGAQEIIVQFGDLAFALELSEGVHGEHAVRLLVHEHGVEAPVDRYECAARKRVFPREGIRGPVPVPGACEAVRVAGGHHAAFRYDGDARFFEIRNGFGRRYLFQGGNVEFRPVGFALDFFKHHVDGAARGRKLGDFVEADTAGKVAFLFGASDLLAPGELEPQADGGFQGFLHADGGIGGGDGVNARSGGGKARILGVHGGDDGNARLMRCAAYGGAGEPVAPGVEGGACDKEIGRELLDPRERLFGAGLLVFGEKAVAAEYGADDFGLLAQYLIEQRAGADGAGPVGYGMIAPLLAPQACEELVQVVNDPKFTAHAWPPGNYSFKAIFQELYTILPEPSYRGLLKNP